MLKLNPKLLTEELEKLKDVYSTEEVKTNKIWIDGRPIYRKVSEIGDLGADVEHKIDININNLDTIVNINGFSSIPNNNFSVPINFYNYADVGGLYCFYDKNLNKLLCKSSWGMTGLYFILEYTKTTDIV